jgi:hypothetical protein
LATAEQGTNDLPAFVKNGWQTRALPSFYYALYTSKEPFKHFRNSSPELAKLAQQVVNAAYPDENYLIRKHNDPIVNLVSISPRMQWLLTCLQACLRLTEKRSKIAKQAVDDVEKFFKSNEFVGNLIKIQDYSEWARKVQGPALHSTPTPQNCTVPFTHPDYIVKNLMSSLGCVLYSLHGS